MIQSEEILGALRRRADGQHYNRDQPARKVPPQRPLLKSSLAQPPTRRRSPPAPTATITDRHPYPDPASSSTNRRPTAQQGPVRAKPAAHTSGPKGPVRTASGPNVSGRGTTKQPSVRESAQHQRDEPRGPPAKRDSSQAQGQAPESASAGAGRGGAGSGLLRMGIQAMAARNATKMVG